MRCLRALCICSALPAVPVHTRTAFHIIQSRHERFNAISTGTLTSLALSRCSLTADYDRDERVRQPADLPAGTGVLFPGAGSRLLSLGTSPPPCLVVIDGTWSEAGRILRKNEWLSALPRYALAPAPGEESAYKVRRQPRRECLSTCEAVARCLQTLEPTSSVAVERLLGAFSLLVSQQEDSIAGASSASLRRHTRRARTNPAASLTRRGFADGTSWLACFGEMYCGKLLSWSAVRPDGELFQRFLNVDEPDVAAQLRSVVDAHAPEDELWVSREAATSPNRCSEAQLAADWRGWVQPGERAATWAPKAARAMEDILMHAAPLSDAESVLPVREAYAALEVARRGGRRGESARLLSAAVACEKEAAEAAERQLDTMAAAAASARVMRELALVAGLLHALERVAGEA